MYSNVKGLPCRNPILDSLLTSELCTDLNLKLESESVWKSPELGTLQEIGMETIEIVGVVLGVIAMAVIAWDAWRDNRR